MGWLELINWEGLKNPHPMFRIFTPEDPNNPKDPFYLKVARLQTLLMKRPLWLSDEYRTQESIEAIIHSYFSGISFNIFYEVGDFQALLGFMDIHPEFKCDLTLKLIDKKLWGADFVRASKQLVEKFMKEMRLRRVSMETADKRIVRMAKMADFNEEGYRPDSLRWEGKFYPKYILGKYGEI
jgi:RimJ/RimL family protein N-acetyltransferase